MKASNIDRLPLDTAKSDEARQLRKLAPRYVQSVIEDTNALPKIDSVKELRSEHISALGGGADAAAYIVKASDAQVIIKFSYKGLRAETEALDAWRQRSVRVPKVFVRGVVPASKKSKRPVQYMVQETLVDRHGRLAETCEAYLLRKPRQARAVGRLLGIELTKMHQAVAERHFGGFADSNDKKAPFASWNSFVLGYLMAQEPYLRRIGVPDDQLEKIHQYIKDYHFSPRGRYIHGDFSARNSAVISQEPLKLAIFDPNALIGDPSWDIAVMANNRAYQKCRLESDDKQRDLYQRDTQLLIGLRQGYGRRIDEGSLAISQLAQAAFHASNKDKPDASSLEGRAWRRCVTDQINSLLRELKNEA